MSEDVTIRYDPRDLAELRVYCGDSFPCRAINPELAGETIGAQRHHPRPQRAPGQLRATLADREATVEALLQIRRGQLPLAEPPIPESEPTLSSPMPAKPRLKRYFNDE
jgi:putative transposase